MAIDLVRTLDMSVLYEGSEAERLASAKGLFNCFAKQGFVKLVNHLISDATVEKAFEYSRLFFKMPEEAKKKVVHPPCANPNRGWSALGQEESSKISDYEKGKEEIGMDIFDAKEAWDQGPSDDPLFPNIWPDDKDLPGFRDFMEPFYDLCHQVHIDIIRALQLAVSDKDKPFIVEPMCTPNTSELRFNYYPPIDIAEIKTGTVSRISPHTDSGTLTLLFQDQVGGLEIEDQSNMGTYVPLTHDSKNVMLVNIGDSLQRLTNDTLSSVSHRVTIPADQKHKSEGMLGERYSMVYLAKLSREHSLKPLDCFVSDDIPAKYPDINAHDWLQSKLARIYGGC